MIPFFFRTYRNAPLATFISLLATGCYTVALLCTLGYLMNWEGIRDEIPLGTCLLIAAVSAAAGFGLGKLAEYLAERKAAARAAKESARQADSGQSAAYTSASTRSTNYTAASRPAETNRSSVKFCPACGTQVRAEDRFCGNCGARLSSSAVSSVSSSSSAYTSTASASTPAPAPTEAKKKGPVGILVAIAIVALAYGGGKLLGRQAAGGLSGNSPLPTAAVSLAPRPTIEPIQTLAPLPTVTPLPTTNLEPPTVNTPAPNTEAWDYLDATDDEIRALTAYFWGTTDPATGVKYTFFADENVERGGYYVWNMVDGVFRANYAVGTFSVDNLGRDIIVTPDGEAVLFVDNYGDGSDGSILFGYEGNSFSDGQMRLYYNSPLKDSVIDLILNYKNTVQKMRAITG